MNFSKYIISSIILLFFASCEQLLMKGNPETDNSAIFNEYANLVNEKYAMLEFKGLDIQHLQDSISNTITDATTEVELFDKLSIITLQLKDGHTDLSSASAFSGYDFISAYNPGFDYRIINFYIGKDNAPKIKFIEGGELEIKAAYGILPQQDDIGYIWIPSFNEELLDEEVDMIFAEIKDTKGLIIDVRQNTGGDPSLATKFASYLTDKEIYTGFERFKTGPAVGDFSDSKVYLQPTESDNKYLKPVMVLTDRYCYSATTTFAYSVNPLEQVTFVGQRTGGGSGSVADGYLANGWKWSLSTSEFIDHLDRHLDNGFEPDISVALDTFDLTKDEVIERAILELQ